jgi:hypothetical protein
VPRGDGEGEEVFAGLRDGEPKLGDLIGCRFGIANLVVFASRQLRRFMRGA